MIIKKQSDCLFMIEPQGSMKVPVLIFASDQILKSMQKDATLTQAMNVATLPGIIRASIVCPDAHQGYGFSIGGVAAFDMKRGIITPGGIGFDINCGVRLICTSLVEGAVRPKIDALLDELFRSVPCGVGCESGIRLGEKDLDGVLQNGGRWAFRKGLCCEDDILLAEEASCMEAADPDAVGKSARLRGRNQLGTLGAGNHFLEIQCVDRIYDPVRAAIMGIRETGQVTAMIHCGSRGLGHQVCTDYLRMMEDADPALADSLPERDLVYAPAGSPLADKYYGAMCASANYAWANRAIIAQKVRESLAAIFGPRALAVPAYDVSHNIAKIEEHFVNGRMTKVIMHRKGATRAFPQGHMDLPECYRGIGQPVLIPGSMGTFSYVLCGTDQAMKSSFGSTAHGSGRLMSRHATRKLK
ncbi:MAG: RtcB family protein, partial [Candidatus Wallbacteria bacterium]|nr:RtcB family protein [Candidatus Wallbacteria bacterium]